MLEFWLKWIDTHSLPDIWFRVATRFDQVQIEGVKNNWEQEDEMTNVFEYLFPCDANTGDVIIKQGDEGDNFYIVEQVTYFWQDWDWMTNAMLL